MHRVAVIACDEIPLFELSIPLKVFGLDRSATLGVEWYRTTLCAGEPAPLSTCVGARLEGLHSLRAVAHADTVIVPFWRDVTERPPEAFVAAVRRAFERGARIVSLCSGAFVLAAAGILDGRRATTHWVYADELRRQYPLVEVEIDSIYVDEGEVLTSAGSAAGIDLCLHIVRADFGAAIANAVARGIVVAPHREGSQAQFVAWPVVELPDADQIGRALAWLETRLDRPTTVAEMAAQVFMSPRSFARHFRAKTGTTPLQWLLERRLQRAQELLEERDEPVKTIARQCGFGSAASLRQHFRRQTSLSPQTYRRLYGPLSDTAVLRRASSGGSS